MCIIEIPGFVLNASGPLKLVGFVSKYYIFIRYTEHALFNEKAAHT